MARQIVLDTETTGLSTKEGHRIIEIGCIELVNRYRTEHDFHRYINPEREIDKGAIAVHGITSEFLEDKPLFSDIADELFDYLKGAELIIHNAVFDMGFLDYEFGRLKRRIKPLNTYCKVFDTLLFARKKHVAQRNNLDALCKRYNVDNSTRHFHGALKDASLLADVFLAMTREQAKLFEEELDQHGNTPWQTASDISQLEKKKPKTYPLILQKANSQELSLHENFFKDCSTEK